MSVKSSHECKEAATAFGKTIKSDNDVQPGWCIFYNNDVYWDVYWDDGKQEAQEICSNEMIPGGTNSNTRRCSEPKLLSKPKFKCV